MSRTILAWLLCIPAACSKGHADEGVRPPVYLNHVYVVLEEREFAQFSQEKFLTTLAGYAQRSTMTADGSTWSGIYLYGQHTYLEFLKPNAEYAVGSCGIGLGIEEAGGIQPVAATLHQETGEPWTVELQHRTRDEQQIPWFYTSGTRWTSNATSLECWLMEYHPDYLASWYPDSPPEHRGIRRDQYLANRYQPEKPFRNITALTLALSPEHSSNMCQVLRSVGYSINRRDQQTICTGPDLTITLSKAQPGAPLLQEIQFEIRSQPAARHELGRTVLLLQGTTGHWKFSGE
jgi:hypothetical protein